MRKIYPSLFNKFSVLVLYGLLSIAVITLAQLDCELNVNTPKEHHHMIGYVKFFTNRPSNIAPKDIPWKFYDFINVIAYPNLKDPDGPWNGIRLPRDESLRFSQNLLELVSAKNTSQSSTKILLSIRNYDTKDWPPYNVAPNGENVYEAIINETLETLVKYNLDGVDIEYPGMRGLYCGAEIWDEDKGNKDINFVNFITKLRSKMGKSSILMLTVGSDIIEMGGNGDINVANSISFLNIETYHHSLYANIKDAKKKSYPNSPLTEFNAAYKKWDDVYKIDSKIIIMGIDFGNTIQVVDNEDIIENQSVDIEQQNPFTPPTNGNPLAGEYNPFNNVKQINGLCSVDELFLYTWPWKDISKVLDCNVAKSGWIYTFDAKSSTPWLQKRIEESPGHFHYVSFEDAKSISNKLNNAVTKVGGFSISDVSYDSFENEDGSILKFMQNIRGPNLPAQPTSAGPEAPQGNEPTPLSPTNSSNTGEPTEPTVDSKTPVGAIVGGVIGGLFGFIILGACAFIGYRYRKKPKSESFRSLLMSIPSSIKNHSTASRNTEMTFDPSPNLLAPPTTVIPVASGYVTAMFDFTGKEENDLSFKKGDKIEVLERGDGPNDWWVGRVNGAVGEFPGNYVKET